VNLRIRTILPLIISALALLLVVCAGLTAYDAIGRRQDTQAFLKVNQISQLLLHSAGQWAIERGMTNASLKSSDVPSPERRAEIVKLRASGDQAFRDAVQRLGAIPAMKAAEKDIADAARISRSGILLGFRAGISCGLVSAAIVLGVKASGAAGRLWLPLAKCRHANTPARTIKALARSHCGRELSFGGTILVVLELLLCFMTLQIRWLHRFRPCCPVVLRQ